MMRTRYHNLTDPRGVVRRVRASRRSGFTVVELLVVILIGVLLLTIAIPAYNNSVSSSNRTLAANALQASTLMGRDVALTTGRDGAIVFVYDPEIKRIKIIPAIKVGTIREVTTAPSGPGGGFAVGAGDLPYFDRDVFVPAPIGEVLTLPQYWMVRGFASPGSMLDIDSGGDPAATWYNSDAYGGLSVSSPVKRVGHWVFPETGFFPIDQQVAGGGLNGQLAGVNRDLPTTRQSFMIRFDARTGAVSRDNRSALFVDPRNSSKRPWGEMRDLTENERSLRVDIADDLEVWATRVLNSPTLLDSVPYTRGDMTLREQLIGTVSNDTILVKPVTRVALYDERELAMGIGARGLNPETNTIYLPHDQQSSTVDISFDMSLFAGLSESQVVEYIDQWIYGNTTFPRTGSASDGLDSADEPVARLFLVQSYTGELEEVLQ